MTDAEATRLVVDRIAGRLADAGIGRMPARVYVAVLVAPDGALTAAELAEQLAISRGAVSKTAQTLTQMGLIHREYSPELKRDRFAVAGDPLTEAFKARLRWISSFTRLIDESLETVGGPTTPTGARLSAVRDMYVFAANEVDDLLERWQKRQSDGSESTRDRSKMT